MSDMDEHRDLLEINAVRRLLTSKPRTVRWDERRARLDEVGSVWPVAEDIRCEHVVFDGLEGEWSLAPGSDRDKILLFFHGGGYCSGSLKSHRRMVTEAGRAMRMRTLAIAYRRAPEHPFPAQHEDALTAWRFLRRQGIAPDRTVVGGATSPCALSVYCARQASGCRDVFGCVRPGRTFRCPARHYQPRMQSTLSSTGRIWGNWQPPMFPMALVGAIR